ncbi:S-adenosyl-L-methionine-dependent methyltransferase [Nadsonia fulvescens var. elongata DSM 6958]|uniref:S-adenosyl-L-methionine-dependent methyltransferase n=1 Tax=Nadsonia fulvescens var. elongata DSM 6958 TaxID=857566 RepID=A0A1E3PRP3_9ASCO|nr:S-adenosyl-L-methionine-dependent methyltransferase [Nadsonia fulvescens var. elongata DSM 6958]
MDNLDEGQHSGFGTQNILVNQVSQYLLSLKDESQPIFPTRCMLDFGCGSGSLTRLMIPHVTTTLVGVDTSSRAVSAFNHLNGPLKAKDQTIKAIKVDLLNTAESFEEILTSVENHDDRALLTESFDVIVTMLSFHHFPDMDHALSILRKLIVRSRRGHLFIADFFQTGPPPVKESTLSVSACHPLYLEMLNQALSRQGFFKIQMDMTAIRVRMVVKSAVRARDYKRRGFKVFRNEKGKKDGYLVKGHLSVLWARLET